jgi:hypothetical protein
MLEIRKEHLDKFNEIKNQFLYKTNVPEEDNWKSCKNNTIWLYLVRQIIVVGSSLPGDKFWNNSKLRNQVAYNKLIEIKDEEDIKRKISKVLRAVGTRYASSNISKCRKTNALVHNFKVFKNFKEGPRSLLKRISKFSDRGKIKYLMKIFEFLQSKSARDYLMEFGLVKNAIAFDIRVQNVFKKVGIELPRGLENNPKLYDEVEKIALTKICKPLGLLGVEFDRMLYQNYDAIMSMKFS